MPGREGGPATGWVLRPEVAARLHGTMHDAVSAVGGPGSGLSPAGVSPAGLWTEGGGTARQQFRPACLLGAMASGSGPEFRAVAAGFGMDLGICVQLADDLLDVASGPSPGGVPAAGVFASGTVTLPIALAVRDCPELGGLLRPGLSQASRARAARLLSDSRAALSATAATARTYANGAGMRLGAVAGDPVAGDPVAGDLDLASQVAQWPAAYLDSQLRADTSGRYRWLAAPLVGAFR